MPTRSGRARDRGAAGAGWFEVEIDDEIHELREAADGFGLAPERSATDQPDDRAP